MDVVDVVTTSNAVIDLSSVDLSVIGDTIAGLVPTCLALIIPILAIRKGLSFVLSMIHGA